MAPEPARQATARLLRAVAGCAAAHRCSPVSRARWRTNAAAAPTRSKPFPPYAGIPGRSAARPGRNAARPGRRHPCARLRACARCDRAVFGTSGIAWLGASTPQPDLLALHGELAAALQTSGFAVDARLYAPHLTLARHSAVAARAPSGTAGRLAREFVCPGRLRARARRSALPNARRVAARRGLSDGRAKKRPRPSAAAALGDEQKSVTPDSGARQARLSVARCAWRCRSRCAFHLRFGERYHRGESSLPRFRRIPTPSHRRREACGRWMAGAAAWLALGEAAQGARVRRRCGVLRLPSRRSQAPRRRIRRRSGRDAVPDGVAGRGDDHEQREAREPRRMRRSRRERHCFRLHVHRFLSLVGRRFLGAHLMR